eukprot:PITA_19706
MGVQEEDKCRREVEKYKARLVAKGYSQVSGIDFGDIFSPVAKVTSIRLLLSVAAVFDFEVEQMDVKTSFLHGDLEEEIYMKQLELCGEGSKEDHCVYFKLIGDRVIYLVLYVDDMLLVGNDKEIIQDLKTQLSSKFDMKDLGAANYILGAKFYVEQCPKTQEEEEDMSCVPYASVVSSLMYVMVCTRPDIAHAVGVLSRFMSKLGKEHWTIVKRVFRDLCGTSDYGLCYQGRPRLDRIWDICGFVDVNWDGDLDQRRSTSGYVFNLFGGAVSWMSKKQYVVALSTTEA